MKLTPSQFLAKKINARIFKLNNLVGLSSVVVVDFSDDVTDSDHSDLLLHNLLSELI